MRSYLPNRVIVGFIALALLHTGLILSFWGLEGNPLLLAVGPVEATCIPE